MGKQGVPLSESKIKMIINAKKEGTGTDIIADMMGISRSSVTKCWKEYKKNNER